MGMPVEVLTRMLLISAFVSVPTDIFGFLGSEALTILQYVCCTWRVVSLEVASKMLRLHYGDVAVCFPPVSSVRLLARMDVALQRNLEATADQQLKWCC
jgi:hypothetical protein